MEDKLITKSSDIFSKNVGVLSLILQYFGYAHQSAYLLYWLCAKSRTLLGRISSYLVYFFEPMKKEVEFTNDSLLLFMNQKSFENQIFCYINSRIVCNSEILMKGCIKADDILMQSINIDLKLRVDYIKTLYQHFPIICSRFPTAKIGIFIELANNTTLDPYYY